MFDMWYYFKLGAWLFVNLKLLLKPILTVHTLFRAFSSFIQDIERGVSYLKLRPDRVAMQDATAQVCYI